MEITEVRVFPVNDDKLKAFVTITFDDSFVVRDLKIINGNNGLFVAMPSKKRKDGSFRDTAHPLNNETRSLIEDKVLAAYQQELANQGHSPATTESQDDFV
jgi:stage V sporulation protein G